jgi:branched-chain amino acid transport system permease protein
MSAPLTSAKFWAYFIFLLILLALPWVLKGRYGIYLATMVGIFVILVISLNLVVGYTGQISLAHGAFYGIGAYICGILQVREILPFWPALVVAIIGTGILGILVGIPMLRTRGPYFAIGSMCLGIIVSLVLLNWQSLTGGTSLGGIRGPGQLKIGGWVIDFLSNKVYYYFVLIFVVLTIFIVNRLIYSRVGRAFMAIREEEELAEAIGVNPMRFKVLSFAIGAMLAALAGSLYAGYMGAIDPDIASVGMSFNLLVMVLVGGSGTMAGSVIGTVLLWMIPEWLQAAQQYRPLIFGFILLLIIIFMPRGIVGWLRAIHPKIAEWIS